MASNQVISKTARLRAAGRALSTVNPVRNSDQAHQIERPARRLPSETVQEQRNLFVDILQANATRRDTRQFLTRIKPRPPGQSQSADHNARTALHARRLRKSGVNCGALYTPGKAIADSPKFTPVTDLHGDKFSEVPAHASTHVTLVTIRNPHDIDDATLNGIALTLSQLVRLDMHVTICFDLSGVADAKITYSPDAHRVQGERLVQALIKHHPAGARYVDCAFTISNDKLVQAELPQALLQPLRRRCIPITSNLAYSPHGQLVNVHASDATMAMTKAITGHYTTATADLDIVYLHGRNKLERIVVIDPCGGIPSVKRKDRGHVFINLEHELDRIVDDLAQLSKPESTIHVQNLKMLQQCLTILPPETSALIVTPTEAASSSALFRSPSPDEDNDDTLMRAGTRRQKNPLIHNLLTNRPIVSSSLPAARLTHPLQAPSPSLGPTMVKRGMPLLMIPDPRINPWKPPAHGSAAIDLINHPDLNLARLQALIEDSFQRKLDLSHYLLRIQPHLAGIIIAGEYEGAAILTFERPPNAPMADGTTDSSPLPYLDKFAVATRSQGSSGVADIVFQAISSHCFPNGIVWRSKTANPVNKWYFERAKGMVKLASFDQPKANRKNDDDGDEYDEKKKNKSIASELRSKKRDEWTMFWTTDGVERDPRRWAEYVSVCSGVEPSWLD